MTIKLYYQDSEISEAQVKVVDSGKDAAGYYAILDQSCFYPEVEGSRQIQGRLDLPKSWMYSRSKEKSAITRISNCRKTPFLPNWIGKEGGIICSSTRGNIY